MKDPQNSTLLVIGAGLGYQMSERWTVKLQVSQYNTDHYRTRLWSAGAEFHFSENNHRLAINSNPGSSAGVVFSSFAVRQIPSTGCAMICTFFPLDVSLL